MTIKFRAFYPPPATHQDVLLADNRTFPLRDDFKEAVKDLQNAWHDPPKGHLATQLVVYRIDDDNTVTEMQSRVKREVQVYA